MGKLGPEGVALIKKKQWGALDLTHAMNSGAILEMPVKMCDSGMNLHIDMGSNIRCKIPKEETQINLGAKQPKYASVASLVNKHIKFKVMQFKTEEDGTISVTGSRRAVQQECYDTVISKLKPGDIISARVMKVERFGVFCDIGCGITAFLSIKNISINRINDPVRWLRGWKNMYAVVKYIDEDGRIEITHKELLGTWEEQVSGFNVGDTVQGVVSAIENFGTFVDLGQNISGLADNCDGVELRDKVAVYIKEIDRQNSRVRLMIVASDGAKENVGRRFEYKIKDKHISSWRYTPDESSKIIETVFDTE